MSKKDFSGGLDSLLGGAPIQRKETRGRPRTSTREITKSSQEGTRENETRATFIVREDLLEKLKGISYWERRMIKEIVGEALGDYVARYEKEKGQIKPITK